jgi:hypothetical protein
MVAPAVGISLQEFRMHLAQGRVGALLADRFSRQE